MFGKGILTGLGVTLKHFFDSYKADQRRGFGHRYLAGRQEHQGPVKGFVTVQYPEEKLQVPQNFRFFPMLIKDDVTGEDWCTACGICARVCPPQCIWIVRAAKPDGKPEPKPEEFYIDTSICMQCSYCVEYCPFDAIKMDHNYELSTQERWNSWIFDKDRLTVPNSYYTELHPRDAAAEKAVRDEKEAKKKTGGRAAKAAGATPAGVAPTDAAAGHAEMPAVAAPAGAAAGNAETPAPAAPAETKPAVPQPVAASTAKPANTKPLSARATVIEEKNRLAAIMRPDKHVPAPSPAEAAAPATATGTVHTVAVKSPAANMPMPDAPAQDNPSPAAQPAAGPVASAAAGTATPGAKPPSGASPQGAPVEGKKPKRTPEELAALKAANAAIRAKLDNKK